MQEKHKHREVVMLTLENNKLTIKSTELVEIINNFRKLESETIGKSYTALAHYDFYKKIKRELETLELLGLEGDGNISESSYVSSQNKVQPCFELNRDGMLQMLNSESTLVRYKTIEYINELEKKVNKPKLPTTYKEALLQLVEAEEEKERLSKEIKVISDDLDNKNKFLKQISASSNSILIRDLAHLITKKNYKIGEKTLYKKLREWGLIQKNSTKPMQRALEQGLFEKSEYLIQRSYGVETKFTTKVTGKGQVYIIERLLKESKIAFV